MFKSSLLHPTQYWCTFWWCLLNSEMNLDFAAPNMISFVRFARTKDKATAGGLNWNLLIIPPGPSIEISDISAQPGLLCWESELSLECSELEIRRLVRIGISSNSNIVLFWSKCICWSLVKIIFLSYKIVRIVWIFDVNCVDFIYYASWQLPGSNLMLTAMTTPSSLTGSQLELLKIKCRGVSGESRVTPSNKQRL